MGQNRRAVISAGAVQLDQVQRLVREGRARSVSEFVRNALAEALLKERDAQLAEQVERYVSAGHGTEDVDLVAGQAWPTNAHARPRPRPRAKK